MLTVGQSHNYYMVGASADLRSIVLQTISRNSSVILVILRDARTAFKLVKTLRVVRTFGMDLR